MVTVRLVLIVNAQGQATVAHLGDEFEKAITKVPPRRRPRRDS